MASQSVWGTVESQILMRRLTVVGANLLFLWSLSPLGGQASLRVLEKHINAEPHYTSLRYLSTGPGSAARAMDTTFAEALDQVNPLFTAALLAKNNFQRAEDMWGNVKVPRLARFSANATKDHNGWFDVPPAITRTAEDYVSLAGIPVVGRSIAEDASFNLETTQFHLECQPFKQKVVTGPNFTGIYDIVPFPKGANVTEENSPFIHTTFFMLLSDDSERQSARMDAFFGYVNTTKEEPPFARRTLTYTSLSEPTYRIRGGEDNRKINVANCTLGQEHTEIAVDCTAKDGCAAVKIRKSRSDLRPEQITALDHPVLTEFLQILPRAFTDEVSNTPRGEWQRRSIPTEQFMFDTSYPFILPTSNNMEEKGWVDMSLMDPNVFSNRLSLCLNTWFQLSLAPYAYMGRLPSNNMSMYGPDTIPVRDIDAYLPSNKSTVNTTLSDWWLDFTTRSYARDIPFVGATANATTSQPRQIYQCNYAWTAALFGSSFIIFATGVSSLLLKARTLGPETFGFVSSMTYENPYVGLPKGGTMLDAMERSRLLRDVEVHIGDVKGDEEIGHIAFSAGIPLRKLERGRLYT